ncbi:Uncharacterized membrane protein [Pseudooceanicola antarcticus]|uniref:DUF2254 domain-containing protein n=1 Tax=Pseudooceanicola antarcticus TaxID=1247613 RepID=A0A285IZ65_9RHOB|nr:DUF2254 domain-containing protein [Pseudooceanicola antarcticus]PJE25725.1 DUF2254 domain-containing protein [Pseudooceanicola antarcticus]SNY53113.1 Uncharacterized membrane protein [Pseudooceanicola antarcticus]
MLPTLLRRLHAFSRRLVVRVALIAALAFLALALSKLGARVIPEGLDPLVGGEAVDNILKIIANSMLTVTTFSLTVMAAAHRMVASSWTPRAHQMLLQDTVTHTVLATFVGAYLYALSAIILRDLEVFQGRGLMVLFGMTLLVVALIVVAIIRWISHLEMLGSLINTAQRIEESTIEAMRMRMCHPALGAHALDPEKIPEGAEEVRADKSGYLQQLFQDRLQTAAEHHDARIWLLHPVGGFVHRGEVLARISGGGEALAGKLRENAVLGSLRNFDQDPGFGLTCLSEIGVRALSPGVNDPGTALDVLHRILRIFLDTEGEAPDEVRLDRLYLPALDRASLLIEALRPLLLDGKDRPELQTPFTRALQALGEQDDPALSESARALGKDFRT